MFDYRKAFDLIDHSILVSKLSSLKLPRRIINRTIDFLSQRSQRIMINDLAVNNASLWKFVDDTTVSEIMGKGEDSHAKFVADEIVD